MIRRTALALVLLAASSLSASMVAFDGAAIVGVTPLEGELDAAERVLKSEPAGPDPDPRLDHSGHVMSTSGRILALDAVGRRLRVSDPGELGRWSMETLPLLAGPDERVLAARNLAWSGRHVQAVEILGGILSEARQKGFSRFAAVQAMDGVVYLREVSLFPAIEALLEVGDLEIAAAQTIDRLAEAAPLEMTMALNAKPEFLNARPMLRADCFAKADLADASQRKEFEKYLRRPDVPVRAKEKAILGLVQRGHMLTTGLFTGPPELAGPSPDAALVAKILQEWLSCEDFRACHAVMQRCLEWADFGETSDSLVPRQNGD